MSAIDAQSTIANANRITYYSSSNLNRGQYYWTRATLQNSNLGFNSTLVNNATGNYAQSNYLFYLHLNYSSFNAHHSGIEQAELILFDQYMTNNDSLKVDGYLGWKWGLQANFSTAFAFSQIPPALVTGFNGTKSNYFGTAQAVNYLPFQSDAIDIGTYPQQNIITGTPTYQLTAGKTGISLAATRYVTLANTVQAPFTVCYWFNPTGTTYQPAISIWDNTTVLASVEIYHTTFSTVVLMGTRSGVANQWSTTYTNTTGQGAAWNAYSLVCSSNIGTFYVNGVNVATLTGGLTLTSYMNTILIGRSQAFPRTGGGFLRHFTVFNRALNATEISTWSTNTS